MNGVELNTSLPFWLLSTRLFDRFGGLEELVDPVAGATMVWTDRGVFRSAKLTVAPDENSPLSSERQLTEQWLTCALLRHRCKTFLTAHLKSSRGKIFTASRGEVSPLVPAPIDILVSLVQ